MTIDGRLPQERAHPGDIFPGPVDGACALFTPPAFYWLPVVGVDRYQIVVEDARGARVIDEAVTGNLLLPRRVLSPGSYRWNISADGRERGWWSFAIPVDTPERIVPAVDDVLSRVPVAHPKLQYRREDIPDLVARNPERVQALQRTVALALTRGMPPRPRFHTGDPSAPLFREALGVHRAFVDRDLVACALAYLLQGDRVAGAHARASLLTICEWNPAGPCAVDGPWGDEIGVSNARCLASVYDWIQDLLSESERLYVLDTLAQYARQTYRRIIAVRFTERPGDSHVGRLPGYLGQLAIILHGFVDAAESRTWMALVLDIVGSFYPFYGDSDGGWAEGTFYASSYAKWPLPFFFTIERLTGFSFLDHPFYQHVSQFFLHFAAPGWEIHPFCDGYWCLPEDEEWPGFFAQDPFTVFAERFGPDEARRLAASMKPPDVYHLHLFDVFRVPPVTPHADVAGPAANSRAFFGTGFVSMHSTIGQPATDTALLARASPFGAYSHQYADQGNFAIISQGRALITPTGYFGNSYGTDHHRLWTRQTKAHNCLLVDGVGQQSGSHATVGRIESLVDRGDVALASLDLSGAYPQLRSYRRRLLFLRPGVMLIHDEVIAARAVACSWLAHTMSKPHVVRGVLEVEREPASLRLSLHGQAGPIMACAVSDVYDVGINDGVPAHLHRHMPQQYHMAWSVPAAATLRLLAVAAIDGAQVDVRQDAHLVVIHAQGHEIRCDLANGIIAAIVIDGTAMTAIANPLSEVVIRQQRKEGNSHGQKR